jgi:hypothetical protein
MKSSRIGFSRRVPTRFERCWEAASRVLAWRLKWSRTLKHFLEQGLKDSVAPRKAVYATAASFVTSDGEVTDRERAALEHLGTILGLGAELAPYKQQVERVAALSRLRRGELPIINLPVIPLQKQEQVHFVIEDVEFHQERVVSRGYEGSSSGFSFRIARGVTYRTGAHRGRMVSRTSIVRLDGGRAVLTSKRIVFAGSSKGFSIPWRKVLSADAYADGVGLVKDSTAMNNKPFYLLSSDSEFLNAAISACLNNVS